MSELFGGDPDYPKIKAELKPFIVGITKGKRKATPEYVRFKAISSEWNKKMNKAVRTAATVESVQGLIAPLFHQLQAEPEKRKLLAVLNLYRYLGLVESLGAAFLDMLVWLLVANGCDFHVQRIYKVPSIVHAATFKDLEEPNISLGVKLAFLERHGLKKTSKFIDRSLRNDIAHLDFSIDNNGKISTKHSDNVNIFEKITTFLIKFTMINKILQEDLLGKL